MNVLIKNGFYNGTVQLPYSKSYVQRAIAIAALCKNEIEIKGYTACKDAEAAINAINALGKKTKIEGNVLNIFQGSSIHKSVQIHCNESGLSSRIFSIITALLTEIAVITGEGSLLHRPFFDIEKILIHLGKKVVSNKGFLPLHISGNFKASSITIDASESSQILTGLLITLPFANHESCTIHVKKLKSVPYIQMTLDILTHFNINVINKNFETFIIPGNQQTNISYYNVEGDWSAASIHAVAAAISGNVTLQNLNYNSAQADRKIIEILKNCGTTIQYKNSNISIQKNKLIPFQVDATNCPDLFPSLAALAVSCNGISQIKGTERLQYKESNRAETILYTLKNLGININIEHDIMTIEGGKIEKGIVHAHNDHRIAMMGAVLGLISDNGIEIQHAEVVNKSYPDFFEDFYKLTNHE